MTDLANDMTRDELLAIATRAGAVMERLQLLAKYLDEPEVLLQIPQPHRLRISELLHGQ